VLGLKPQNSSATVDPSQVQDMVGEIVKEVLSRLGRV
jgi:hypothetical protein